MLIFLPQEIALNMRIQGLQNQKGFTLVEIAIVLVIIGLLLGGVLKGQELIENTKLKAVKTDSDAISAAVLGFQDRFRVLPGAGADGAITHAESTTETSSTWAKLRSEGFLVGSGVTGQ